MKSILILSIMFFSSASHAQSVERLQVQYQPEQNQTDKKKNALEVLLDEIASRYSPEAAQNLKLAVRDEQGKIILLAGDSFACKVKLNKFRDYSKPSVGYKTFYELKECWFL